MKKIYLLTKACLFTAAMFMVSACTEDDAVVTPIFPEGETVETVAPGTEYTLTFSANMNWELESSKPWCKFSNGFQSIKGEAGENISQKLTITEDDWSLDDEIADITLIMGDEEKIIAKYTRTGKSLTLVDGNDVAFDENNSIKIEYKQVGKGIDVSFKANYDWTIDELPEWIVVENAPLSGTNSELKTINVSIDENYIAYAKEGAIKVKNKNNNEKYCEIPIVYYGIDRISSDINPWAGYTFDAEGKGYKLGSESVEGSLKIENVLINGDNFQIFYLLKSNQYSYSAVSSTSDWMNCVVSETGSYETHEATVSVITKNNDTSVRYGEILVIPNDTLYAIGGETSILTSNKELNEKLSDYILVSISQEGEKIITDSPFVIESTPAASFVLKTDLTATEKERYFGDVYVCKLQANTSYSSFVIKSDEYKHDGENMMWMTASDMGAEWAVNWVDKNSYLLLGAWSTWVEGYEFRYQDSSWNIIDGMSDTHGYDQDGNPIPYVIYVTNGTGEIDVTLVIERSAN